MTMTTTKVEALAWVAIYLGMILVGLGLSLRQGDARFGAAVAVAGGVAVAAGVVLIFVRSRMGGRR